VEGPDTHKSWLTKRVTRDELLADSDGSLRWKESLDDYQDGDEKWKFSSPARCWRNLAGRGGMSLVHDGTIVTSVATIMN